MNDHDLCNFFMWCLIVNAIFFVLWFVVFLAAGDTIYRIHARWFDISREKFASIHYRLMAQYKLAILVLNFVPWLALRILAA